MIFYSDDIKKKIIDESPIEEIIGNLDQFKEDTDMIFTYFNYGSIAIDYIQNLLILYLKDYHHQHHNKDKQDLYLHNIE